MRGTPSRSGVSKVRSARSFRRDARSTAYANLRPIPMRGGFRL